jgi:hypothetical protein
LLPAPKQNVPPGKAARGIDCIVERYAVNIKPRCRTSAKDCNDGGFRRSGGDVEGFFDVGDSQKSKLPASLKLEHVDAQTATLARESRHIVAF